MKIFDCFTFFNELDLLEFRFRLLNNSVDHFVIAESNITFSGKKKEYYFLNNKERYKEWEKKIIYLPIEQTTQGLYFNLDQTTHDTTNGSWSLEFEQRNALKRALPYIHDEDLVLVGDIDEMPDPAILQRLQSKQLPVTLSMLFHNYFLNCQNIKGDRWWNGTVACSGKFFKENGAQVLRDNRNIYPRIKKAGWHFSYLGGVKAIQKKLMSFSHTEYNKKEFLDEVHINNALERGRDILKRKNVRYRFVPLTKYPKDLRDLMHQYPQFIKELPWHKRLLNFFR